jgi:hypothetical protein
VSLFTCALLLTGAVWAQRPSVLSPLQCDIDGDGVMETVGLRPFLQDGVELGQLILFDQEGRILWAGPSQSASPLSPPEPEIFLGEYDLGDLEAAGDFAGNGRVRLLGTYQKSDAGPTRFRLFEWTGQTFAHLRSGWLVPAAQRPATFVWSDEPDDQVWIESFLGWGADGLLRATVVDLRSGERSDILLAPQDEEFVLRLPEGDSL